MELFYAYEADGRFCRLDADESGHCCRVLRPTAAACCGTAPATKST